MKQSKVENGGKGLVFILRHFAAVPTKEALLFLRHTPTGYMITQIQRTERTTYISVSSFVALIYLLHIILTPSAVLFPPMQAATCSHGKPFTKR